VSDATDRLAAALAGRYRIERELGAGGMATVYLAHDVRHDRKVALKVLRPELAAVVGGERFLAEIKTTANLQHPHILPLHDSGEAGGLVFYVMPYVEGESLRERLTREKQLPVEEAVRIATEVADALEYAHQQGVIHRDIKPENVLLHGGHALVADFGIALAASRTAAGAARLTETGMSVGTPAYMAPEQAMGEREITPKADVFALGCVLYEMLTGAPPFTGSTAQAIVAQVLTDRPRSLTEQRHTVPPYIEAAVLTALEKLPADRFESARAFAEAIGNPLRAASRLQPPRRGGAVVSRRATYALAALAGALAVVALLGWLRSTPAAPVIRQRVSLWRHSEEPFLAPGGVRKATQAAIAPDGLSIVFTDSVGGVRQLWLKRHAESEPAALAGTEGAFSPFFSPDGRWIAYLTVDGRLRKIPVDGGGSITLATDATVDNPSGAWLDDGTIVYAGRSDELRQVSAEGGRSRRLGADTSRNPLSVATIWPLPGSRGVLYTACPGNCGVGSAVYVFDFAADSARRLVGDAAGAWYAPGGFLLYTSRDGGLYAAGFDARRLRLTPGAVPVIADVVPGTFTLSRSGVVLYLPGPGGSVPSELMWVSRGGGAVPLDSTWRGGFDYPALSPDGRTVVVSVTERSTQLWIRRADGTRQQLTDSGTVNWRPTWGPNGRWVAFLSNLRGGGTTDEFDAYRIRVDTAAAPQLLLHHAFGLWEVALSHDGEWLVVRSLETGGAWNLRVRRVHGDTALMPLVVGKNITSEVALSPDGRWLAYASDATGREEIYVTPLPAGHAVHMVSREGGTEPRWAHSGRELFFKSDNWLMAVPVRTRPTFTAGTPRRLFSVAGYRAARNRQEYDVAPDDRHFVMIRDLAADARGNVVYVEHWFAELAAKVRAGR
jgi:Tol biopolymer transport system component